MPMGVVNESEFEKELSSLDKPLPTSKPFVTSIKESVLEGEVLNAPTPGRGIGSTEVPDSLRRLIGEEAAINGRKEAVLLSNSLGLSPSSTSAYSHSANSTASYNQVNPGIKNQIVKARERISRKARKVLTSALDNITDDKLSNSKAIDLSTIAKNMSSIVIDMEEDINTGKNGTGNSIRALVIIAPQPIDESKFEVVRVNE